MNPLQQTSDSPTLDSMTMTPSATTPYHGEVYKDAQGCIDQYDPVAPQQWVERQAAPA